MRVWLLLLVGRWYSGLLGGRLHVCMSSVSMILSWEEAI